MNRRDFIKTGIVGITALSSGIGVGGILLNDKKTNRNFSAYAFLSSDKKTIIDCLSLFKNKINNNDFTSSLNYKLLDKIINKKFSVTNIGFSSSSFFEIKLTQLKNKIQSDIFISEGEKIVLDPTKEFSNSYLEFRENIKGTNANCLLSIELVEKKFFFDILNDDEKFITIENKKGIFDKISLSKNYSSIICPGEIGNTEIEILNGKVNINNSPCRHKLCQKMSIYNNTIACVPNKVLIKTV